VTFLTEITSNTATATLLMPVLAAAAVGVDVPPQLLMIPAAISASCAFMLPVATAPNAIVYATEKLTIARMAREGFVLNLIIAAIVASVCYFTVA
jgi:sodium-dependent dicarboxylate transporter 2/3/5